MKNLIRCLVFLISAFTSLAFTNTDVEAVDRLFISPIDHYDPVVITSCNENEIRYRISTDSQYYRTLTLHNVPSIVSSYTFKPEVINSSSDSILTLKLRKIVSGFYYRHAILHVRGTDGNHMIGANSSLYVTELEVTALDVDHKQKPYSELVSPKRIRSNTPYTIGVHTTPYPAHYPTISPMENKYPDDYMHFSYEARKYIHQYWFNSARFNPPHILGTGGPGLFNEPGLSGFSFVTPPSNHVGRYSIYFSTWYGEGRCNIVYSKQYLLDIYDKPSIHTDNYGSLHSTGVSLLGTVHPKWSETTVWFEYGTTTSYGQRTPDHIIEYHRKDLQVAHHISNLLPETTYHFRFVGKNETNTIVYGEDHTFTTPSAPPPPTPTWEELGQGVHGADLLSDGEHLYRVGGIGHCTNIYKYDGLSLNTWALLTDANPQCWGHFSPGEGNRSWYYGDKIIVAGHSHPGHPGGNMVTMYDIANSTWTGHELPLLGDFSDLSWGQLGALNAITGEVYISWTEDWGTGHEYVTSALDVASGTWGPTYDRDSRIGQGHVVLEDTSGQYVFDLIRGDRYVQLRIYNLQTQPDDFSGTWTLSSTHDMGDGLFFMDAARSHGSDVMAWSPQENQLYLVATEHGVTLEYDPDADIWRELDQRPIGHGYRDGHVVVVDDYLYSQNGNKLWYLNIP